MSDSGKDKWSRLVLPVAHAVMRTCWLYPWALLAGLWVRPGRDESLLSGPAIFVLLLAGDLATRWVLRRHWPLARVRLCLITMGLLADLLVLRVDYYGQYAALDPGWLGPMGAAFAAALPRPPAPVLAAAFGLYLWWRGLASGRSRIAFDAIENAFKIGLLALVAFVIVSLAAMPTAWDLLQAGAGAHVVGFLFVGLVALSLARLEAIRERSRARGEAALRLNRQWLGLVLGVAATLLLCALALASALSFDLIAAVAGPLLGPLGSLAWLLFEAVALLVGLLITPLFYIIRWLLHPGEPPAIQPQDLSVVEQLQREGTRAVLPPEIELIAKWVAIVAIAGLTLLVLARAISRPRAWAGDDEVDEERESVWGWRSAATTLLARLHALWLQPAHQFRLGPRPRAADHGADVAPPITIRQVYWHLLRLGSRLGIARAISTTPYEHLPRLLNRLGSADDVAAITQAYVRARYGPEVPTDGETGDTRERWQRVLAQTTESAGGAEADVPGPAVPAVDAVVDEEKKARW